MEGFKEKFRLRLSKTKLDFTRDFIHEIDWKDRLIGIKGPRGVGKTTLLLQYVLLKKLDVEKTLYISLDDLYFSKNTLYELASSFCRQGGTVLLIDEVHRYKNWSSELKNIYDDLDDLQVIFTGSSHIQLSKAKGDLSRRAIMYQLQGLSFREYLEYEKIAKFKSYSLDEICKNHIAISESVLEKIKPLEHFPKYLKSGYLPFYKENRDNYLQRLNETVILSLEIDFPAAYDINFSTVDKLKQLLMVVAEAVPFTPNISKLTQMMPSKTNRNAVVEHLHFLQDGGLLHLLSSSALGITRMQKPEKIYLSHPNLIYALTNNKVEIGTVRETFVINQLKRKHKVLFTDKGDFKIDNKLSIEVGGKSKTSKQIKGAGNAIIAADDIEIGFGSKIPLWLLGFMY
jgi:uncharacterized protein